MNRLLAWRICAVFLTGMAAGFSMLHAGAQPGPDAVGTSAAPAQRMQARTVAATAQAPTLTAQPTQFAARTTASVEFRVAMPSGTATRIRSARLIQLDGGREKPIGTMEASQSAVAQGYSGRAQFNEAAPGAVRVVAEFEFLVGHDNQLRTARTQPVTLNVTPAPTETSGRHGTGEPPGRQVPREPPGGDISNALVAIASALLHDNRPPQPPPPPMEPQQLPPEQTQRPPERIPERPQPAVQTVSAHGISMRYPANWQVNRAVIADSGPLALNNFNNHYVKGGVPPAGGAEVDVTFVPRRNTSAESAIERDLAGVTRQRSEFVKVDGSAGTRVWYQDEFAPTFVTENAVVYVNRGDRIYKFFLTYHAGDPEEKLLVRQFQQMLDTVQFEE